MKSIFTIENVYKVFVSLTVATIIVTILVLSSDVKASNPVEGNPVVKADPTTENVIWIDEAAFEKWQFEQSQFLTRINNKALVAEFLFLCENSSYIATIENWHKFIHNYKAFYSAYRAYKQGFNVEFDDLLN